MLGKRIFIARTLVPALLAGLLLQPAPGAAVPPAAPASYCYEHTLDDGRPRPQCIALVRYNGDVCAAIRRDAEAAGLPPGYFARLLWQESRFDPNALSRAGARGIAQFTPETGRLQGLANPYNPAEALWQSAQYLARLKSKFGNLGLAAAAYNGGENRVARFIAGTGYLAAETLDYVQIVTGLPVTAWLAGDVEESDYALRWGWPFEDACVEMAENRRIGSFTPPSAIVQPWGVQVAQFFSRRTAERAFARLQSRYAAVLSSEALMLVAKRNPNFGPTLRFTAEIGRDSRADADALCARLRKAGGSCLVVSNR